MKLENLLDRQLVYTYNRSRFVRLRRLTLTQSNSNHPAVAADVFDILSQQSHTCQAVVKCGSIVPTLNAGHLNVRCSCDFFKYYCEYPLSKWRAASIYYSNGEPAIFTNPSNYPLICEHLHKLLSHIQENFE